MRTRQPRHRTRPPWGLLAGSRRPVQGWGGVPGLLRSFTNGGLGRISEFELESPDKAAEGDRWQFPTRDSGRAVRKLSLSSAPPHHPLQGRGAGPRAPPSLPPWLPPPWPPTHQGRAAGLGPPRRPRRSLHRLPDLEHAGQQQSARGGPAPPAPPAPHTFSSETLRPSLHCHRPSHHSHLNATSGPNGCFLPQIRPGSPLTPSFPPDAASAPGKGCR